MTGIQAPCGQHEAFDKRFEGRVHLLMPVSVMGGLARGSSQRPIDETAKRRRHRRRIVGSLERSAAALD
jgi:hypothetical protein